jgi:hypothetical protein
MTSELVRYAEGLANLGAIASLELLRAELAQDAHAEDDDQDEDEDEDDY